MKMTAKEAKEQKIFIIENFEVSETNLFEFVMQSAEETTSPRGVENKLHIREKEINCDCEDEEGIINEKCNKCNGEGFYNEFQVWDWGFIGQYPVNIETFYTEEEAEDFIFHRIYEYDFMSDDQRDTTYFYTIEEAEAEMISRYADLWSVKKETVISILKHKKLLMKSASNAKKNSANRGKQK